MKKMISTLLFVLSFSAVAAADEIYKFECTAHSIQAKGDLSKLVFSEDGASLDGDFLEADNVSAFANQSIVKSKNKYVNGKNAQVLTATVTKAILQMTYDGYPKNDPTHIVTSIFNVELSVSNEQGAVRKYVGTCSEQYQGD